MNVTRGSIYYVDLNPTLGNEQRGFRPMLIIQNNIGNCHAPTVIVAAITSKAARLPTHVSFGEPFCRGTIMLEQIRTIDKRRLRYFIGEVSAATLQQVNHALMVSCGMVQPV